MRLAICSLESTAPYSASRPHMEPKLPKELANDYEERTWRERLHAMPDGRVFLPPMGFKWSLASAARFLGHQIPGKGKATYTKHFMSGILITDPLILPVKKDDVPRTPIYANADGKRGSGSRVMRFFPTIHEWRGDLQVYVLDDLIGEDVFTEHLAEAGKFIGIGQFRPENGGFCGRWRVNEVKWTDA